MEVPPGPLLLRGLRGEPPTDLELDLRGRKQNLRPSCADSENPSQPHPPQAAFFFGYQGFYMHEDNTELDPIAFRLAFGVIVVLIGMKQAQLVRGT